MNNKVSDILHRGEENATSAGDISLLLNVDRRELRRMIHQERRDGIPILSSSKGLFMPSEDPKAAVSEIQAFRRKMLDAAHAHFEDVRPAAMLLKTILEGKAGQ